MGKSVHNNVLDDGLNHIKNNVDLMVMCSAEPTNYTEAFTTYKLASVAMTGTDFTLADGDTSGRKITVAAKSAVAVTANGTGTHVALVDTGTNELTHVTSLAASKAVTTSDTVDFPAYDEEIADPT